MVGGNMKDAQEWHSRHLGDAEWVKQNVAKYGKTVRAAIIFAQARPKEPQEDFFQIAIESATAFGKPVMYLHGDGHKYEVEEGWRAPNITRVQVDQVAKARPLMITVTEDPKKPFLFDRRLDN
jgi:hypothetical protein